MKNLLFILLLGVTALFASGGKTVLGIAFGASQTEVVEAIFKQGYTPEERPGIVTVPVYRFGDLPVEIICHFNHDGKFYSYEMRTGAVESNRFAKVLEALEYLSKQMSQRFGQPVTRNNLTYNAVLGKKASPYWIWADREYDVETFLRTRDSRFFAQSIVTQKALAGDR